MNPINYLYQKYLNKKPKLTWYDMKDIIAAEGSIYDEFNHDSEKILEAYPTEEAFYSEVLERYNRRHKLTE